MPGKTIFTRSILSVPLAILTIFLLGGYQIAPVGAGSAGDAVSFGRQEITRALTARGLASRIDIRVGGPGTPESYTISFKKGTVSIEAPDSNGALYGALELAERITRRGKAALGGDAVKGRPFLRDRGWNLFLTLPWDYKAANTDYDPKALTDPERWWFANDGYWRTLFDQMARARMNWLDIHGTWDISVTDAPNLYAYFIQSGRFPKVGVTEEIKRENLRRLNTVIRMAHARGIRVSLMAYEARFHTPHSPDPYPENENDLYAYTREVVEKMIRQAPGLDAIGFRIGESGHGESFFNCYTEAVKASGRDIPLVTRSWIAKKPLIVPLAKASGNFTVEIKYNGEQWGAPHMVMGGRMTGWYSYSFEDYLSSSDSSGAEHMWPGYPAADGTSWPSEPYKVVWQVRANGTHRILPVYDPEAVRRAVRSMPLGTASGFVLEGPETYYPKSQRYYMADPDDVYTDWIHQRDWMYLNLWGRLGYDPGTTDETFDAMVGDRLGAAAAPLVESWKAASRIISTAFSAFSLGPDHRNHAIELEWGGDTKSYLLSEPFDSHVFTSIREAVASSAAGAPDGRIRTEETAALLKSYAAVAERAASISPDQAPQAERKRLHELVTVCGQAARLGRYYAERFLSAYRQGQSERGVPEAAGKATAHMQAAEKAWSELAECPFYKPFTERLRMRTNTYHWANELPKIKAEAERLAKIAAPVEDPAGPLPQKIRFPELAVTYRAGTVSLSVPAAGLTRAWALVKPLPSSAFFHRFRMTSSGGNFTYEFRRENWGHSVAAEIETADQLYRIPGLAGSAPYIVVPSITGPAPLLYSSEEALAFLDPSVLSPSKHGCLLVSSRARNFHQGFSVPLQRKLLDPVRRGLTLIVLAQDYSAGRYTLDWLPKPIAAEQCQETKFDPAGALGLTRIDDREILRQRFLPSPGWEVPGNGGMAMLKWGDGRIVLVNARLLERLYIQGSAVALEALLGLTGGDKPVVVVDAGTDGGVYTSSVVMDFMNSHDIPFLTLGEVIAREQGMNATRTIAGTLDDDDLLASQNIRGDAMVNACLDKKVKSAAALPIPESRAEFEQRREGQRRELLRALGLDPMPERTSLKARITGTLRRKGYRIEKIVFESRPNFPVTAHLYVPDGSEGKQLPVIVNPHGHWEYKKQEPTVQSRLIGQVLHGYLALVLDSPGFSFEGDNRIERRGAGTHDDLRLVLGSQSATNVYVWDLIRALDYLATRPEADMSRVGLTGASGGGLATMWAFAAEPRFTCAASVVYASSMEINPNNGCLCNHVPGSLQIGDRSDVLGLRAPAPILIIGAEEDREFPAKGMRLTEEKLTKIWGLYGKSADAWLRMFPGGHDYSKPMRETSLGFFDRYLKGGDGAPVPEPSHQTEPPLAEELYVLPVPPAATLTMRDIAQSMFEHKAKGSAADYIRINGGLPEAIHPELKILENGADKSRCTYLSEPGLTVPAIYWAAKGPARALAVLVSDRGKSEAAEEFNVGKLREAGIACMAIDPRGLGELKGLDLRLQTYLGQAPAFAMGWDITRAIEARNLGTEKIAVIGRGPASGQAALAAAMIEPRIRFVAGLGTLKEFQDAFRDDVPLVAIQPRANYVPGLPSLRKELKAEAVWGIIGEREPDWTAALIRWAQE